jgi:hypothetical protein
MQALNPQYHGVSYPGGCIGSARDRAEDENFEIRRLERLFDQTRGSVECRMRRRDETTASVNNANPTGAEESRSEG